MFLRNPYIPEADSRTANKNVPSQPTDENAGHVFESYEFFANCVDRRKKIVLGVRECDSRQAHGKKLIYSRQNNRIAKGRQPEKNSGSISQLTKAMLRRLNC
jgi:hypothetical protein